ncbi:MAG: 2-C-methyl-D-erythritol 2,4-cyclodiphosphate synthase [Opitutae bacterium]|jgi:2-C-methyl-D-erythritol 2,4-cyclodiphosphate synthase|nr:2-C-methyl-D-erythritol 2,4-cyclodiphosphate synthase [Opitutae bacterium]|tara:strand:+ start:15303 stop:15794 length:492 start_codon:yes stop_codon:yes gene_type:complete
MNHPFRIGQGYDVHRFAEGRKLILGGIEIPHALGLEGHSDADCLIHALADAILGAVGLPDIGFHFPPSEPALEGIDSMKILLKAKEQCETKGYLIGNVDATIIAEKPRISPYVEAMKERLSKILEVETNQVGIKATTNEGIGGIGNGEGIAAHAVCLLISNLV